MTTEATMMNDIIEEPERDSLLDAQPERPVESVMAANANANPVPTGSWLTGSGRLASFASLRFSFLLL